MPIYMQFPNATGSVTTQGFQGWIELTSAAFGMDRPSDSRFGTSSYAATGKLQVHPITVTKRTDSASPQLTIAALQGTFDKTVNIAFTVTAQGGGMSNLMSYKLTNCGISSAQTSGGGGADGTPTETYTLSFGEIQFTFNKMDQSGNSSPTITGYNLEQATSL